MQAFYLKSTSHLAVPSRLEELQLFIDHFEGVIVQLRQVIDQLSRVIVISGPLPH